MPEGETGLLLYFRLKALLLSSVCGLLVTGLLIWPAIADTLEACLLEHTDPPSDTAAVTSTAITGPLTPEQIAAGEKRLRELHVVNEIPFETVDRGSLKEAFGGKIPDLAGNKEFEGWKLFGHTIVKPKAGKEISYFVDKDGILYLSEKPIDFASMPSVAVMRNTDPAKLGQAIIPVEGGRLHFDSKSKLVFDKEYSAQKLPEDLDPSKSGVAAVAAPDAVGDAVGDAAAVATRKGPLKVSEVIKCSSLVSKTTGVWAFIGLPIAVDMAIQGGLMAYHGTFHTPLGKTVRAELDGVRFRRFAGGPGPAFASFDGVHFIC